ncbi:MAG: ComEC family competence protein [Clostridiales bacterium]|nr:ComEC family competence protein [Clostridiales bacterium]
MQKIINFRPFLITMIFAVFAVICGILFATVNNIVGIVAVCVLFIIAVVLTILFRKNTSRLITFILCAFMSIWCFAYAGAYLIERNAVVEYTEEVSIVGRVCDVQSSDGSHALVLENLVIDDDNESGKMRVILDENDSSTFYVNVGDKVSFISQPIVSKINFEDISFNEIKYYAYISLDELKVYAGSLNFREQILQSLRSTYNNWLGEYGELAYGIITGDKNGLSGELRTAYSVSGLAHILAVSGLHVGFLMSLITFLLRKLRVNKNIQPFICLAVLLAYNFLVGFSYSIMRASIMFMIAFSARIKGKWSDPLNNLCLAVSVIVCIFPFSIFDVGFIMSVGCVLTIILFSKGLTEFFLRLSKNRFKKFFSTLSVCICAQVGVFPAMTFYFSSFSTYSIPANIIAMPILNLIYIFVLVFGLLTAFIPIFGYVLALAKYLFMVVDWINLGISYLPLSEVIVYGSTSMFILYLLYFVVSKYVMLRKKIIAVTCCVLLSVSIIVVDNVRFTSDTHLVYSHARYDVSSIVKTNDKYALVGDLTKYSKIEKCIKDARIHAIDSIYVTHLSNNNLEFLIGLVDKYKVNAVYIREDTDALLAYELVKNNVNVKHTLEQNVIQEISISGKFVGYKYKGILFTSYKTDFKSISKELLASYKVVRAYSQKEIEGVNFALNFEYKENEDAVGANEDTVLLDYDTMAQKRF